MRARDLLVLNLALLSCAFVACGGGGGAAEQDSGAIDSAIVDSGPDSRGDALDASDVDVIVDTASDAPPILPEGGVAMAPLAGAVVAHDARYVLVTSTGQGGARGAMTSGRYELRGAKIAATAK